MALTGAFAAHLAPGIRQIIGTRFDGRESYYNKLYNVETSTRNYEDYRYATGLPIAVEKPEGADIQSFDPIEGGSKRMTHKVWAIGFEVSMEAWEDDLYAGKGSALRAAAEGLADSLAERVEYEAHRPFLAEGFTGTTFSVIPSNLCFFNTAHTVVGGAVGSTWANKPTTNVDLSVTSYRAALIHFRKLKNDQGLRIPGFLRPANLIVPPDSEYDALEILRSPNRPDTANDVKNVTMGMTGLIVDPYITDTNTFIVQAQKHYCYFLWRKRPMYDAFDDRRARVAINVGLERFSYAPVAAYGYYASPGVS